MSTAQLRQRATRRRRRNAVTACGRLPLLFAAVLILVLVLRSPAGADAKVPASSLQKGDQRRSRESYGNSADENEDGNDDYAQDDDDDDDDDGDQDDEDEDEDEDEDDYDEDDYDEDEDDDEGDLDSRDNDLNAYQTRSNFLLRKLQDRGGVQVVLGGSQSSPKGAWQMKSADGTSFECKFSVADYDDHTTAHPGGGRRTTSGATTDLPTVPVAEAALQPLEGKCISIRKGYWSYDVCHKNGVFQYHGTSRAKAGVTWSLGTFNPDASSILTSDSQGSDKQVALAVVHHFVDGQPCDETGKPRVSRVVYFCCPHLKGPSGMDYQLESLTENQVCSYTVTMCTRTLCDVGFVPRGSTDAWTILRSLSGLCFQDTIDWWSYSLCVERDVSQFHMEESVTSKGQRSVERTSEYSLGIFRADKSFKIPSRLSSGMKLEKEVNARTLLYVDRDPRNPAVVQVYAGASRGIGRECVLALAKLGCNVVIAAKTTEPHPTLPGTIYTVAKECEELGVQALPVKVDVRSEEDVQACIDLTMKTFGRIDILINNASSLWWHDIVDTPMKRADLIYEVNTRGTFMMTKACLPHMVKNGYGHVINMSPPLSTQRLAGHTAYYISKFGMTLVALGAGQEYPGVVAGNSLWPRTVIESLASKNHKLGTPDMWRKATIISDCVLLLISKGLNHSGHTCIDEELLRENGMEDFSRYQVVAGSEPPSMADLASAGGKELNKRGRALVRAPKSSKL
ncbi:Hydroxysteroid dehydrogenase-like protein 2 [Hondaea fermentalgiana]|uniref:Hydroxysteroid dehydrogenase-like protein 2 n=1 Tax=Hondaea fermentalgiana TaxID=2315210 RepID=A0A2R5GI15_9STRA|nr:Hydroxysteroid dehydrogenase-like protein 2 [Hondaea fermentalgiana]|eukprot:GBG30536.1 Hydroxysteroid dehydrogenase-like protein 2 [Hondaea fermentalgiana]